MQTIHKTWTILNSKQRKQMIELFVIQFIGSILELLGVSVLLPFLQVLLTPEKLMKNAIVSKIMCFFHINNMEGLIIFLLIVVILSFIIKNLYMVFMTYMRYQIVWKNRAKMEVDTMKYYINQSYQFHTYNNPAEMQRTVLTDIGNVFTVIDNAFMLVSDFITGALLFAFLFASDMITTLVVLLLLLIFMGLYFKVFKKRLMQYGRISQKYGAEGLRSIQQIFHCIKEIKVYKREQFFTDEFCNGRNIQMSMMKRAGFVQQVPKYFLELICTAGILCLILIRVLLGGDIAQLVTQLGVFAVAAYRILPAANRINTNMACIVNNKASVDLIYSVIMDSKKINNARSEKKKVNNANINMTTSEEKKDIVAEHLSFTYHNSEQIILDDVSFVVKAGKSTAFKGPSGAGKTTTIDLILGILEPTVGRILYGNCDIHPLLANGSVKMGYIPQSIYLSDDTLKNNIAFGVEKPDEEKIWKALREAQLEDFVKKLDDGINSRMGEGGIRLSGGQKQRIGIARALYDNPDVLILDEATSALDSETEQAVMDSINYLRGKKTLIIIAHRLSTIENCDTIYEVADAKIKLVNEQ